MMQTNRVLDYSDKSCPILTKEDVVVSTKRQSEKQSGNFLTSNSIFAE